jgi:hypothetical protein
MPVATHTQKKHIPSPQEDYLDLSNLDDLLGGGMSPATTSPSTMDGHVCLALDCKGVFAWCGESS